MTAAAAKRRILQREAEESADLICDNNSGKNHRGGKGRKNELLEQIKELEAGVEDQEEDYDIEREIQPEKEKNARKGKARKKKNSLFGIL